MRFERQIILPVGWPRALIDVEMENASKPKTQRRKEARPSEIIEAGINEFAAHGFERARLDRIAKSAGIAKGTVYLYYESKEALFLAAAEKYVVQVMAENEAQPDSPLTALRRSVLPRAK